MNNSGMNSALLKFQIGPVQDFIAQARSTRDLWSGSYLLSWLMAAGLAKLVREIEAPLLILPSACYGNSSLWPPCLPWIGWPTRIKWAAIPDATVKTMSCRQTASALSSHQTALSVLENSAIYAQVSPVHLGKSE